MTAQNLVAGVLHRRGCAWPRWITGLMTDEDTEMRRAKSCLFP